MKTLKSLNVIVLVAIIGMGIIVTTNFGCKKDKIRGCMDPKSTNYNPDAEEDDGSCVAAVIPPGTSSSELLSLKVSTPPTIDGSIDAAWGNCQKLVTSATVPDPGAKYFNGYVGDSYDVTVRSMYDANNIYFLAEWNDATNSQNRQSWYFDPATKRWNQEKNKPVFDASGTKTREAFYEDKFAMLWNVNNSVSAFNSQGCYASCHTGLDPATHFGAPALHYTNSASERIDMWHWKLVRTDANGQLDDQYQDNNEFGNKDGKPEGGRKGDPKTSGGDSDNKQKLLLTGTTDSVYVPKYVIPNKINYYWILKSEIDAGTAKLVTGVDTNGVLTYSGGTINPVTDTEFQRKGTTTGSKCMPSVYTTAFVGDRGDITAKGVHTGSGWVLEYSRPLNSTGVATNTDVQFVTTSEYVFGIGVFDNSAIAHAIKPFLTLKFKQ